MLAQYITAAFRYYPASYMQCIALVWFGGSSTTVDASYRNGMYICLDDVAVTTAFNASLYKVKQ